jgi:hypothetical protein
LDVAVDVANALDLPLPYFSAISNLPSANERHYAFMNQGFGDTEEDLEARQIGFILRRPRHAFIVGLCAGQLFDSSLMGTFLYALRRDLLMSLCK